MLIFISIQNTLRSSRLCSSRKTLVALKRAVCLVWALADPGLGAFASDASCQLDVLWHDGHSLGVNRAQVGVLEQADQVGLAGFLQGHNGGALEAEIGLEVLA